MILIGTASAIAATAVGATQTVRHMRKQLRVVTVRGTSMMPNLRPGERILIRTGRIPMPGEIVVFAAPDQSGGELVWMVKRAIALPGDPVPMDVAIPGSPPIADRTVPAGCVVVRGDHLSSQDSRHFGYIRFDAVLGTMLRILSR